MTPSSGESPIDPVDESGHGQQPQPMGGWSPPPSNPVPADVSGTSGGAAVAATAASGAIVGRARDVQWRQEQQAPWDPNQTPMMVLTFRVQRYDTAGNELDPIPVDMRGRAFDGVLGEGDWVEIKQGWQPGLTLTPRRLRNLSNGGAQLAVRDRGWPRWLVVSFVVVGAIVVALLVVAVVLIVQVVTDGPSPPFDLPSPSQ